MPAFAGALAAAAGVSGGARTGCVHSSGPARREQTVCTGAIESVPLLSCGGVTRVTY